MLKQIADTSGVNGGIAISRAEAYANFKEKNDTVEFGTKIYHYAVCHYQPCFKHFTI